jgi:hypothetical protein
VSATIVPTPGRGHQPSGAAILAGERSQALLELLPFAEERRREPLRAASANWSLAMRRCRRLPRRCRISAGGEKFIGAALGRRCMRSAPHLHRHHSARYECTVDGNPATLVERQPGVFTFTA